MKLELLITTPCSACDQARAIWQKVAAMEQVPLRVLDVADWEGEACMQRLSLKTVPAIVIDDVLKGVGVQSEQDARRLIQARQDAA
jgi:hypothetical protein